MAPRRRSDHLLAFMSPLFLGMAPLFGKLAYQGGSDPFTVAAIRTAIAAAILWALYLVFWRQNIYIYPAGLFGCVIIGVVNGIGSLLFYSGLARLDASLAQLLNGMYVIFVALLAHLGGQPITTRTLVRLLLALVALILLTGFSGGRIDWVGVGLMLGNAILFAGTILLSQRVLVDIPAQTVTLYSLTTMAVVVAMVRLATGFYATDVRLSQAAATAIVLLGASTAAARLTMFLGVKRLGSLQTALIAITEIGLTLILAFVFLGERLAIIQWFGVGLLGTSILLMHRAERQSASTTEPSRPETTAFTLFHLIAFNQAFGRDAPTVTPEEMEAIRRMMGSAADHPPPSQPGTTDRLPTASDNPLLR